MKTVCCGCGAVLADDGIPSADAAELVSHGLCVRCLVRLYPQLAADVLRPWCDDRNLTWGPHDLAGVRSRWAIPAREETRGMPVTISGVPSSGDRVSAVRREPRIRDKGQVIEKAGA